MVLIMGQQVAAKRRRRLQMRSGAGRAADGCAGRGCAGRECWVPQSRIFGELADPRVQALTELHLGISCLFLEWVTRLSFMESSSLPTSPLQFTATPLLIQEKKQRLFYNGENSEKAERMGL